MSKAKDTQGRFRRVWGAPIVLALLGAAGLIAALIGDGILDAVSYLSLAVPLAVIAWAVARRTR